MLLVACSSGGSKSSSGASASTGGGLPPAPTVAKTTSGQSAATGSTSGQSGSSTTGSSAGASTGAIPNVTVQTGAGIGDACGLLNKQDVATALGEAVGDGQGTTVGNQTLTPGVTASISACDFDATNSARSVSVDLWKISGASGGQLKQLLQQLICAQKEAVSGLGDVACWYDSDHREIQILKGSSFIDLTFSEIGAADRTTVIKALAGKAIAKLP
jgi:hypothetical protein